MAGRLSTFFDELVFANRILAREDITDAFGHVSCRHPGRADRFLLSRARTPQCIEVDDLMEFTLDGAPVDARGRAPYSERFIHAAIYASRPDVASVIHSHSLNTIPFGCGGETIRPMLHNCALIGEQVPIWDSRLAFGDTDLMVTNIEMGRDLARSVGANPTCLMRGHGFVAVGRNLRRAVFVAIKLHEAARLQAEAARYDNITFLSPGEIKKMIAALDAYDDRPLMGIDRAWEYWCHRAQVPFRPDIAPRSGRSGRTSRQSRKRAAK